MRNRFLLVSGLALGVLFLVSSGVRADNYETTFSLPSDATVSVTYTNPGNPTGTALGPEGTWAVPFTMTDTTTKATFQAFCIDLYHNVSSGEVTTNPKGGPSFVTVAGALGNGATTGGTTAAIPNYSGFTSDFGSKLNYLGYVYETIQATHKNDDYLMGAVQLAVWHLLDVNFTISTTGIQTGLLNDYNNLLLAIGGTGANGSSSSQILSTVDGKTITIASYSTSAPGNYSVYGGEVLVVHTNLDDGAGTTVQNVITWVPVPEPSSMAIAGLGALGFLAFGLRRRKVS